MFLIPSTVTISGKIHATFTCKSVLEMLNSLAAWANGPAQHRYIDEQGKRSATVDGKCVAPAALRRDVIPAPATHHTRICWHDARVLSRYRLLDGSEQALHRKGTCACQGFRELWGKLVTDDG